MPAAVTAATAILAARAGTAAAILPAAAAATSAAATAMVAAAVSCAVFAAKAASCASTVAFTAVTVAATTPSSAATTAFATATAIAAALAAAAAAVNAASAKPVTPAAAGTVSTEPCAASAASAAAAAAPAAEPGWQLDEREHPRRRRRLRCAFCFMACFSSLDIAFTLPTVFGSARAARLKELLRSAAVRVVWMSFAVWLFGSFEVSSNMQAGTVKDVPSLEVAVFWVLESIATCSPETMMLTELGVSTDVVLVLFDSVPSIETSSS